MSDAMPAEGTPAPEFSATDQDGNSVASKDLKGKWVVLYFYPKDNTPGCTREACNFRDNHVELTAKGAAVLGVSGDSEASHARFANKYSLPFPLLADTDHTIARAYGAYGPKKLYGREYEGITRSTFIIDPEGKVAKVWKKVKPDQHGAEVLTWLNSHAQN
jgi:thioredoxin-dependent peroxiredoxin